MKRFNRDGKFHIGRWTKPDDQAAWNVLVSQPGRYRASIRYAANQQSAGRKYVVELGDQSIAKTVEATGEWYSYKDFDLGVVTLPRKGALSVRIHPGDTGLPNLMYFESLSLEPETVGGALGRID